MRIQSQHGGIGAVNTLVLREKIENTSPTILFNERRKHKGDGDILSARTDDGVKLS